MEIKTDIEDLDNKYTFKNFIVDDSNKKAYNLIRELVENPDNENNLLFIYGKNSLGKTHLLCSALSYIKENRSNINIIYVSGSEFAKDYTTLNSVDFKDKYYNKDILIIDDIQFLEGSKLVGEELVNIIHETKQVILSSNCSIDELNISDILKELLYNGTQVEIGIPSLLLKEKLTIYELERWNVKDKADSEVINYIAINCNNDMRLIQGSVRRLAAYINENNNMINMEVAKEILEKFLTNEK